jgi:hypothetical protein
MKGETVMGIKVYNPYTPSRRQMTGSQKQLLRNPYWNLKIEKLVVTTRVKSL